MWSVLYSLQQQTLTVKYYLTQKWKIPTKMLHFLSVQNSDGVPEALIWRGLLIKLKKILKNEKRRR
jgi:hypothetical protein